MSHAVAISLCSAIELSLNEWGGNCESRMITWTRLGLSSRGWHCFMNCSAWEVDSPHVCVRCISLWESRTHLSPIIAVQWVSWLLYSLSSKDFWSHRYDQLYLLAVVLRGITPVSSFSTLRKLLLSKGKVMITGTKASVQISRITL